jgi:hypothetical protein
LFESKLSKIDHRAADRSVKGHQHRRCRAHHGSITNGPRFDAAMPSEERKSAENGIWLCQNCAKLIDNDERRYSKDLLIEWKRLSEQAALLEVENLTLFPLQVIPTQMTWSCSVFIPNVLIGQRSKIPLE